MVSVLNGPAPGTSSSRYAMLPPSLPWPRRPAEWSGVQRYARRGRLGDKAVGIPRGLRRREAQPKNAGGGLLDVASWCEPVWSRPQMIAGLKPRDAHLVRISSRLSKIAVHFRRASSSCSTTSSVLPISLESSNDAARDGRVE